MPTTCWGWLPEWVTWGFPLGLLQYKWGANKTCTCTLERGSTWRGCSFGFGLDERLPVEGTAHAKPWERKENLNILIKGILRSTSSKQQLFWNPLGFRVFVEFCCCSVYFAMIGFPTTHLDPLRICIIRSWTRTI